jgi:hypothetical protein
MVSALKDDDAYIPNSVEMSGSHGRTKIITGWVGLRPASSSRSPAGSDRCSLKVLALLAFDCVRPNMGGKSSMVRMVYFFPPPHLSFIVYCLTASFFGFLAPSDRSDGANGSDRELCARRVGEARSSRCSLHEDGSSRRYCGREVDL